MQAGGDYTCQGMEITLVFGVTVAVAITGSIRITFVATVTSTITVTVRVADTVMLIEVLQSLLCSWRFCNCDVVVVLGYGCRWRLARVRVSTISVTRVAARVTKVAARV